nr:PREDICTED: required for meiotic nuclear division protein 1 homolog [Bemisia tabaci]
MSFIMLNSLKFCSKWCQVLSKGNAHYTWRLLVPESSFSSSSCSSNLIRFLNTKVASPKFVPKGALFSPKIRSGLTIRKKKLRDTIPNKHGYWNVVAFSTAEEYDLDNIRIGLETKNLYEVHPLDTEGVQAGTDSFIHAVAHYQVEEEPRQIFIFREGSVVLWNVSELEYTNFLMFLKHYELQSYDEKLIESERELMHYKYTDSLKKSTLMNGNIYLCKDSSSNFDLDLYTFSNAMASSVKLGIWEATLEKYVESIEYITEDMKMGRRIKIGPKEVLRKTGEIFALRHSINLSSDLLDVPDFYWDREQLEKLYLLTCNYFSIPRRTKIMNEKLNHCLELVELLSTHLSDRHHVRLEWMIIVLIMVEVAFEFIHYYNTYYVGGT